MKKFVLFLIFFTIITIYYAAPYQYWFAKVLSVVRPGDENSRTLYYGYVKIESTTFEKIIAVLREKGCKEAGLPTSEVSACYYQRKQLPKTGDSLLIFPNGMGWGPISFIATADKLFFPKDILGKPSLDKLKAEVREDALFAGLQVRENSWKLESVMYPWDAIY